MDKEKNKEITKKKVLIITGGIIVILLIITGLMLSNPEDSSRETQREIPESTPDRGLPNPPTSRENPEEPENIPPEPPTNMPKEPIGDEPKPKSEFPVLGKVKDQGQLLWMHPNGQGWKAILENKPNEWDTTLKNIDGFGVFLSDVNNASQSDVNKVVAFLQKRGLYLQVETAGLRPGACTGEKGALIDIPMLAKLKVAGMKHVILRNDAPVFYTVKSDSSCGNTTTKAVEEYVKYMKIIQDQYPDVEFTWNEPIGFFDIGQYPSSSTIYNIGKIEQIFSQIFNATKAQKLNLIGFTADASVEVTAYYPNGQANGQGWDRLKYLENLVHSYNKRFSILLNFSGKQCPNCINGKTATNEEFYKATLGYYDCYASNGGKLDDVYPESWWNHPTKVVPEELQYSFANLMLGFIERLNGQSSSPSCNFIDNTFIPEEWGFGIDEVTSHTRR